MNLEFFRAGTAGNCRSLFSRNVIVDLSYHHLSNLDGKSWWHLSVWLPEDFPQLWLSLMSVWHEYNRSNYLKIRSDLSDIDCSVISVYSLYIITIIISYRFVNIFHTFCVFRLFKLFAASRDVRGSDCSKIPSIQNISPFHRLKDHCLWPLSVKLLNVM